MNVSMRVTQSLPISKQFFWVNTRWHDLRSLLEGMPLFLVYFDIGHLTVKLLFFFSFFFLHPLSLSLTQIRQHLDAQCGSN